MSEFRRRLMMQSKTEKHNLVEYIQANEKSYIELDYIPNANTRLVIQFVRNQNNNDPLFYASQDAVNSRFVIIVNDTGTYFVFGTFTGGADYLQYANESKKTTIDVDLINDYITQQSEGKSESKKITSQYTNYKTQLNNCTPLCFFIRKDMNVFAKYVSIYSVLVYDNGVLIYDLKPFDDGDKNGLVNTLNNKIYTDVNGFLFKTTVNP